MYHILLGTVRLSVFSHVRRIISDSVPPTRSHTVLNEFQKQVVFVLSTSHLTLKHP